MRKIFLLIGLLVGTYCLEAQRYISAVGLRGGKGGAGITYQQRLFPKHTVEGILSFGSDQTMFTGLYEYHKPLVTQGLNLYFGAGPHFGRQRLETDSTGFWGLSGVVGAEFKFPALPLVISADVKPDFHVNHTKAMQWQTGVSIRYVLVSIRDVKKKKRQKARAKSRKQEPDDVLGKAKHRTQAWWDRNMQNNKKKKKKKRRR